MMKVKAKASPQGTSHPCHPLPLPLPLETITLVPHVPCHSDEDVFTITTQVTPQPHHKESVPDLLVIDISAGDLASFTTHIPTSVTSYPYVANTSDKAPLHITTSVTQTRHTKLKKTISHNIKTPHQPTLTTNPKATSNITAHQSTDITNPKASSSIITSHQSIHITNSKATSNITSHQSTHITYPKAISNITTSHQPTLITNPKATSNIITSHQSTDITNPKATSRITRTPHQPTHITNARRVTSRNIEPLRRACNVVGDSFTNQGTPDTPYTHTKPNTTHTTTLIPASHLSPQLESTAEFTTSNHHTTSYNVPPATTCSFCGVTDSTTVMSDLTAPLPHTSLDPITLLRSLGVAPSSSALSNKTTLCRECHSLVHKGDEAYQRVLEVVDRMRRQWCGLARLPTLPGTNQLSNKTPGIPVIGATPIVIPTTGISTPPLATVTPAKAPPPNQLSNKSLGIPGVTTPTPPQSTVTPAIERPAKTPPLTTPVKTTKLPLPSQPKSVRKVRPLLPKPTSMKTCHLCGMTFSTTDWPLHASTHHHLVPRWRNPKLQGALKLQLAREMQKGASQHSQRCPACCYSIPQHEFVQHLKGHHSISVEGCLKSGRVRKGKYKVDRMKREVMVEEKEEEGIVEEDGLVEKEEKVEKNTIDKERRVEAEEEIVEEEDTMKKQEQEVEEERIVEDSVMKPKDQVEENVIDEEQKLEENNLNQKQEQEVEDITIKEQVEEVEKNHNTDSHKQEVEHCGVLGRAQGCKWRCRVCAAVFISQQDYDRHKATSHPDTVRVKRTTKHSAHTRKDITVHKDLLHDPIGCQEGAIIILEGDGRGGVTHHRLHTTTSQNHSPEFQCPSCPEVFTERLALVRHRQALHSKPGDVDGVVLVECPLCGRRLAGTSALHHHLSRVHHHSPHPPLRHRCRVCLHQCHTRPQLERHMRERHGAPPPAPPVPCGHCGKTYSARYIDSHVANMHSDRTRFSCTFCPMKFGAKGILRTHMSMEHANTSWRCQECPMQFSKYHQLRQHRLYVHSQAEHRCLQCPRTFKRRCDLTEHIKRRHQERQGRECSFCPKVYSDRKRLRLHLMRKHSVAWEDTLAKSYAHRQRENNCLRRRQRQQQTHSPSPPPEQQQPATGEGGEGGEGGVIEGSEQYSVVHLTESPHPLTDTISYIILEEG